MELSNSLLNEKKKVKTEIKKEIKDFVKFNENEDTAYPKLWNIMKVVLRKIHRIKSLHKKNN